MPVVLLLLGLGGVLWGGRLAFDVRGAAHASAERARLATELNAAAAGNLDPPSNQWTVRRFRLAGARVFAAGLVLLLAGLLEL